MFLVLQYKRRGRGDMLQRKGGYCYLPFVLYRHAMFLREMAVITDREKTYKKSVKTPHRRLGLPQPTYPKEMSLR